MSPAALGEPPWGGAAAFRAMIEHSFVPSAEDLAQRRRPRQAHLELAATVPVVRLGFRPQTDRFAALVAHVAAAVRRRPERRRATPPPTASRS